MKKNLGLLSLLITIILGTYYFEEIKGHKEYIEMKDKERVFKEFNQLTGFKTKKYELKKFENWQVDNLAYPANQKLVEDFILILANIRIVGVIDDIDEIQYFKRDNHPFSLMVGENSYQYQLGDISELTGKFYIKSFSGEPKIYICEDQSLFNGAYKDEVDLALKKYLRLRSFLIGQEDLFIERNLFHSLASEKILKAKIDNKRNRWFEIDLENKQTNPAKFPAIKYKKLGEVLHFLFERSVVKKLYGPGQYILTNQVSEIDFTLESKKEIKVKLYAGLNDQFGYYAKFNNLDYIFELDENTSRIFHTHVQDFWNKRFLLDIDFSKIASIDFSLSKNGKDYFPFMINDLKKFSILAVNPKVTSINNNLMNFLFNLIFNLVDFKEADFIEIIEDQVPSQLYLKVFDRHFGVSIMDRAVDVRDLGANLRYHFNYNTQHLKTDTLDRIFTLTKN